MASSRKAFHADTEEIVPLIADRQADPVAVAPGPAAAAAPMERSLDARRAECRKRLEEITRAEPVPFPWWRRLPFLRPDRNSFPVGRPLNAEQINMLCESSVPGYFEQLATERQFVTACVQQFNNLNSGTDYEPAPGKVTKHSCFSKGMFWTHGNFVARRKRSGCFSFLPGPRTLFFFETVYCNGFTGLLTCTPLDEPVTEAYSVFGFPLWFSKRRSGKLDTICNTCSRRWKICEHANARKVCEMCKICEHANARKVCEMCYKRSTVLHPDGFGFGCTDRQLSTAAIK